MADAPNKGIRHFLPPAGLLLFIFSAILLSATPEHEAQKRRCSMRSECDKKDVADCIKKKAYELWEKDGRKQGCDMHYWLKAEKLVKSKKIR